MRKFILAIAIACAIALPTSAEAKTIHQHVRIPETGELVTNVVQVAPADSDDDGIANKDDQCPSVAGDGAYGGCPPPVHTATTYGSSTSGVGSTTASSTYSYSSSGGCGGVTPYSGGGQCWAIPYNIVQCESGGQNVPNSTGSGANGYYQLMVGGTGDKASQDAAAAALWNGGAGASNWVCAG